MYVYIVFMKITEYFLLFSMKEYVKLSYGVTLPKNRIDFKGTETVSKHLK